MENITELTAIEIKFKELIKMNKDLLKENKELKELLIDWKYAKIKELLNLHKKTTELLERI